MSDNSDVDSVTAAERDAFLRRQGWSEELPESERQEIESHWSDADIRQAIDMNLA